MLSRPRATSRMTCCSRCVRVANRSEVLPGVTGSRHLRNILLDGHCYRVEQGLVAERLCEEIDGSGLHGLDRHGDVAMAGEEDDRLQVALRCQLVLKIEAAGPGHADVEHQAARAVGKLRFQQFAR